MTSTHDRILNAVDRLFDEQIVFLERLVRFKSVRNEEVAVYDFI